MKIYNYDEHGVFLSESTAAEHPLWVKGADFARFIVPARATLVAPPSEPGCAAVYNDATGTWSLCPDYRGQIWYNLDTPVAITAVGDPAERGLTRSPVAIKLSDEEVRLAELAKNDPAGVIAAQRKAAAAAVLEAYAG
jgi:hypothetical protein